MLECYLNEFIQTTNILTATHIHFFLKKQCQTNSGRNKSDRKLIGLFTFQTVNDRLEPDIGVHSLKSV